LSDALALDVAAVLQLGRVTRNDVGCRGRKIESGCLLQPAPLKMTLEVTPKSLRLRKRLLDANARKCAANAAAA